MIDSYALEGHRSVSPKWYMVIVSCVSSLFLNSNVMHTVLVWTREWRVCGISMPLRKKRMFLTHSVFARRFSSFVFVRRYLYDLSAKKNGHIASAVMVIILTVEVLVCNFLRIHTGSAFCCTTILSLFLCPLYCYCRTKLRFPPSSRRGSGKLWDPKDCAT